MVATVFVNFCATILATVGMNFQLHVKSLGGKSTDKLQNLVMGDYPSNYNSETQMMVFDIGTIQYQQSRDIIINTQEVDDLMFYYTYKIGGAAFKSQPQTLSHFPISDIDNNYQYHHCYCYFSTINVHYRLVMVWHVFHAVYPEILYLFQS